MIQRPFFCIESCGTFARLPMCWSVIVSVLIGCGRSEPNETAIVDPPAPSITEPATDRDSGQTLPDSGLELPEGEIPPPESNKKPSDTRGIEMPDGAASATHPNILYASWNEIQAVAESTGKVTVVDVWSLSCEPCLKEFPGLVHLHQEMGAVVQCVAVDMDFDGRKSRPPEHYADRVASFLTSVGAAGFPIYISNTPSDDIFKTMKIPSLPAVLVYGADGKVAKIFVDAGKTAGFSYEQDIAPMVSELVR